MEFPKQENYQTNELKTETVNGVQTEYVLKMNKFDPCKNSPNLFLQKLEFRMKNYFLEQELANDCFSLDSK